MDSGRVDDVLLGLVVDEVNLHGLDVEVGGRNGRLSIIAETWWVVGRSFLTLMDMARAA